MLLFSIDGAQLYRNKTSDCWISMFVILNLSPDQRVKKAYVIPSDFFPGPHKPKPLETFSYVQFHHISALMKEGLQVWDGHLQEQVRGDLFLAFATADTIALAQLSGRCGHFSKFGCRYGCDQPGRRKSDDTHYYPAALKPDNFTVSCCDHKDVDYWEPKKSSAESEERSIQGPHEKKPT